MLGPSLTYTHPVRPGSVPSVLENPLHSRGDSQSYPRDPELKEHTYLSPALPLALGSMGKCLSHRARAGVCTSVATCVGN